MGIYKKMDLKGSGVQEEERVKRGDKGRKAPSGLMVPVFLPIKNAKLSSL